MSDWLKICPLEDIPRLGAKVVKADGRGDIAVFRTLDDEVFALELIGVAFVIGGAEGIPPELSRAAEVRLSLSSMTLPHRLARVLLLEQIYRGLSITRGEPYARE